MTKRNGKSLFVYHPTEGRAYTRSPDAIVPSSNPCRRHIADGMWTKIL